MWSAVTQLPFIVIGLVFVWIGGAVAIACGVMWLARPARRREIVRRYPLEGVTWSIAGPMIGPLALFLVVMVLNEDRDALTSTALGACFAGCVAVVTIAPLVGRLPGRALAWVMLAIAVATAVVFEAARLNHPPTTIVADTLAEIPMLVGGIVNAVFAVGKARIAAPVVGDGPARANGEAQDSGEVETRVP